MNNSKHIVASVSDIKDGEMKTITIKGKNITIARIGTDYFGFDDTCTHQECSLGTGFLEGTAVICPCHGAQFDVTSGKVISLPATRDLQTYTVYSQGDDIILEIA